MGERQHDEEPSAPRMRETAEGAVVSDNVPGEEADALPDPTRADTDTGSELGEGREHGD